MSMKDEFVDDCVCPNGVDHRAAGSIKLVYMVLSVVGIGAVYALVEAVKWMTRTVSTAVAAVDWLLVGSISSGVVGVVILLVVLNEWSVMRYNKGLPGLRSSLWSFLGSLRPNRVHNRVRQYFYRRELGKIQRKQPELLRSLSLEQALELTSHHEYKLPAEKILAYSKAFLDVQSKAHGNRVNQYRVCQN